MKKQRRRQRMRSTTLDDIARDRLIRWRKSAGMTQKQLGGFCGRSGIWISRYENAYYDSDLDTLARMAAAFDKTILQVLGHRDDPIEQEIIENFRAIPRPSGREMVRAMLRELAVGADVASASSSSPRRAAALGPLNGAARAARRATRAARPA